MRLNESGPSLFRSEEIRIREDNKVESESVDVRFFANIAVMFAFVSGAGRNGKNELLSQKCPQAASLVAEERGFGCVRDVGGDTDNDRDSQF